MLILLIFSGVIVLTEQMNSENVFCCRHYREVEIPLRQSQGRDEQNGTGKPGTSRDSATFSRYDLYESVNKCL